ncbi:hypothetical protein [Burkholderia pseudomallei]|nr:hypothetical protein [Burkholderia pseudomallei]
MTTFALAPEMSIIDIMSNAFLTDFLQMARDNAICFFKARQTGLEK